MTNQAARFVFTGLAGVWLAASICCGSEFADSQMPASGQIDFTVDQVRIDGFGFSEAFGRAEAIRQLAADRQRQLLDLLFSRDTGAGMSILRIGIDTDSIIQPSDPGGPNAAPRYVWDGSDGGQVWLARQAQGYGVTRFYADAWSAPGYMKTNGSLSNGGILCGVPGAEACGDWRAAYARLLVQFVRFYRQEGVEITELGATNEPDITTEYASMRLDEAQHVDFAKVLGRIVRESGLNLRIVCCDATGWAVQRRYSSAIEADPEAARSVDVHAGHTYSSKATEPLLATSKPIWMSEYGLSGSTWNATWDSGEAASNGLVLANDIHDTLALGNVNAYITWYGASNARGTRALAFVENGSFQVSKRLYAMAAYGRFVRPGAWRVQARSGLPTVKVTAFRNPDGGRLVELINNAAESREMEISLDASAADAMPEAYVTDESRSLERAQVAAVRGRSLAVTLAPRSLTTIALSPRP